jgi:hypothetical protein
METQRPGGNTNAQRGDLVIRGADTSTGAGTSRLTVVEQIYHENESGPRAIPTVPFTRTIDSEEETYGRNFKVSEDWQEIDTGWVKDSVGHVYLRNAEDFRGPNQPTEEELEALQSRPIIVGIVAANRELSSACVEEFAELSPRESMRLFPRNFGRYRIRSAGGTVRAYVAITPK